jgi:hypothetical protein
MTIPVFSVTTAKADGGIALTSDGAAGTTRLAIDANNLQTVLADALGVTDFVVVGLAADGTPRKITVAQFTAAILAAINEGQAAQTTVRVGANGEMEFRFNPETNQGEVWINGVCQQKWPGIAS